ncbi:MAG: phage major capsid protein [Bauldia sp.]
MKHFRDYRGCETALEYKAEGDEPDAAAKAIDDLAKTINEKLTVITADAKKVNDKVDALVAKGNRPGTETKDKDETKELEKKAFAAFIRKGREALSADEFKTLRVSDDTNGGYLATPDFVAEVDKKHRAVLARPRRRPRRPDLFRLGDHSAPHRQTDWQLGRRDGNADGNGIDLRPSGDPDRRNGLLRRRVEQAARRRRGRYRRRGGVRRGRRIRPHGRPRLRLRQRCEKAARLHERYERRLHARR